MAYATVLKIPQYFRNLHRVGEILRVMVKHGFGDLVQRLNLGAYLESGIKLVYPPFSANLSTKNFNTRVRLVLEELGPTFIKLGQVVATRPDIFPVSLTFELRKLQDRVPSFPTAEAIKIIEAELGQTVEQLFADFDQTPLAAASMAQVHRATLKSGEAVVVKIQRPNLDRILSTDLEILTGLASLIEDAIPETRSWSPSLLVEEFSRGVRRECDFRREAQNAELFSANFAEESCVVIPKIFKELSSKNLLVEEFIDAIKIDDLKGIESSAIDRRNAAETICKIVMRSIFEHGFFHADPHAGNILVTRDNRIALIDFGSMGRIEKTRLSQILQFLVALFSRDLNRLVRVLQETRIAPINLDEVQLKIQLSEIVDHYLTQPLESMDLAGLMTDIFELTRRHGVKPPADLLLIVKSISTLQNIGTTLAPDFVPLKSIQPYLLERYISSINDPSLYATYLSEAADSYMKLLGDLPNDIRAIFRDLARGELKVKTELSGLGDVQEHQNRLINRALYAVVGITLVIGSLFALISHSSNFPSFLSYLMLVLGVFALFQVWRAVRRSGGL